MTYTLLTPLEPVETVDPGDGQPVIVYGFATFLIEDDYGQKHKQRLSGMNLSDAAAFDARIQGYCVDFAQALAEKYGADNDAVAIDQQIQSKIGVEVPFASGVAVATVSDPAKL